MQSYKCIYMDPPWPERGGGKSKRGADRHYPLLSVSQIHETVYDALARYDVFDSGPPTMAGLQRLAEDAHCWIWVTDNYLEAGLGLMRSLGFKYKRTLVWVKISPGNIRKFTDEIIDSGGHFSQSPGYPKYRKHIYELAQDRIEAGALVRTGLGQYARGSHELLLLGTKGKAHVPAPPDRPKSVQFAPVSEHSRKPEVFAEIIERCSPGPRLEMFARRPRKGWDVWGNEVENEDD